MESKNKGYNLTIPVNGIQLSYDDVGDGSTPIIFLHGFPFDKTMWHGQLDFLKASYRLIACDIRGFGKSVDENSTLSIDLFADDLIALMDALTFDKAIICGLSMGGFIALNAYQRFPDRFAGLVLCDTQCIADTPEVKEKRYKIIEEIERTGANDFNSTFIKNVFHKDSLVNKRELVDQLSEVVFSNSQQIIQHGLVALAERTETCTTLGAVGVPTLILCGREDAVTPLVQSEYMHQHIKWSILYIIDNAGHVSNLEQPLEFNNSLRDFLNTIDESDVVELSNHSSKVDYRPRKGLDIPNNKP
jgi:3-oxoadipate enol-lactonase